MLSLKLRRHEGLFIAYNHKKKHHNLAMIMYSVPGGGGIQVCSTIRIFLSPKPLLKFLFPLFEIHLSQIWVQKFIYYLHMNQSIRSNPDWNIPQIASYINIDTLFIFICVLYIVIVKYWHEFLVFSEILPFYKSSFLAREEHTYQNQTTTAILLLMKISQYLYITLLFYHMYLK